MSQLLAVSVRTRVTNGMSPVEMNQRAREVVDAIDAETGNRTAHAARVQQLYAVGAQINQCRSLRARWNIAHRIVQFVMEVFVSNYGLGMAR